VQSSPMQQQLQVGMRDAAHAYLAQQRCAGGPIRGLEHVRQLVDNGNRQRVHPDASLAVAAGVQQRALHVGHHARHKALLVADLDCKRLVGVARGQRQQIRGPGFGHVGTWQQGRSGKASRFRIISEDDSFGSETDLRTCHLLYIGMPQDATLTSCDDDDDDDRYTVPKPTSWPINMRCSGGSQRADMPVGLHGVMRGEGIRGGQQGV
jgi:hypothetical protein